MKTPTKEYVLWIILVIMIILALVPRANAQEVKPKPTERVFYVPFTKAQLIALNSESNKADSAIINGHNLVPTVGLLRSLIGIFNESYSQQMQQVADTVKKQPKKPVKQ